MVICLGVLKKNCTRVCREFCPLVVLYWYEKALYIKRKCLVRLLAKWRICAVSQKMGNVATYVFDSSIPSAPAKNTERKR